MLSIFGNAVFPRVNQLLRVEQSGPYGPTRTTSGQYIAAPLSRPRRSHRFARPLSALSRGQKKDASIVIRPPTHCWHTLFSPTYTYTPSFPPLQKSIQFFFSSNILLVRVLTLALPFSFGSLSHGLSSSDFVDWHPPHRSKLLPFRFTNLYIILIIRSFFV